MSKKDVNKRVRGPLDYVFIVVTASLILSPILSINGRKKPALEQQVQESTIALPDATLVDTPQSNPYILDSTGYFEAQRDSSYITQ